MNKKAYAFIGDIHSQIEPLATALDYCRENGRTPILLGDLFDSRCEKSDTVAVYETVREAQADLGAVVLNSNHQDKLIRSLKGNRVQLSLVPELERTLAEFAESNVQRDELLSWLEELPLGFVFRDSRGTEYRAAHAHFPSWLNLPEYENFVVINDSRREVRKLMLYGSKDPKTYQRRTWWAETTQRDWVRVAGHYHVVHTSERSLVLDGGCGGMTRNWWSDEKPSLVLYDVEIQKMVEWAVNPTF